MIGPAEGAPLWTRLEAVRAALEGDVAPDQIPALVGVLEEAKATLLVRQTERTEVTYPTEERDQLITVDELAARLAVDTRWVYDHVDTDLKGIVRRIGSRTLRFSSEALDRWLASR